MCGRRVVWPIDPATQSIILKIDWFLLSRFAGTFDLTNPSHPLANVRNSTELLMGDIKQQMIRRKSPKAAIYVQYPL